MCQPLYVTSKVHVQKVYDHQKCFRLVLLQVCAFSLWNDNTNNLELCIIHRDLVSPTHFFFFMPYCKHEFKADCKNQRCSIQFGWSTENWTSYLCCIIALVFRLMLHRITRGTEIVWFRQCQWGCGNCPFWGLYLMPSLGCSKCTKTSGCLWSRPASCCPKKI